MRGRPGWYALSQVGRECGGIGPHGGQGRCGMAQPGVTDWIDVSVTVRHGMPHWPDNPPIMLERVMDLRRGDDCNVSHLAMGVHSGTHMDAPVHFIHHGAGLDEMPLAATMGEARVIQIDDPREITADELRAHNVQAGEQVLFRTSNSARCWQADSFVEDFVYITEPAAEHLAATRVQTVGSTTCPWAATTLTGPNPPHPARSGHLDHRRTRPFAGRSLPVRDDLPAGQAARLYGAPARATTPAGGPARAGPRQRGRRHEAAVVSGGPALLLSCGCGNRGAGSRQGRHQRDLRSDAGREPQEGVDGGGGVRRFQVRPCPVCGLLRSGGPGRAGAWL